MFLQPRNIPQSLITNTLVQSMSSGVLRLLQPLKAESIKVSAGNSVGSVTLLRLLQPLKALLSVVTFGREENMMCPLMFLQFLNA